MWTGSYCPSTSQVRHDEQRCFSSFWWQFLRCGTNDRFQGIWSSNQSPPSTAGHCVQRSAAICWKGCWGWSVVISSSFLCRDCFSVQKQEPRTLVPRLFAHDCAPPPPHLFIPIMTIHHWKLLGLFTPGTVYTQSMCMFMSMCVCACACVP